MRVHFCQALVHPLVLVVRRAVVQAVLVYLHQVQVVRVHFHHPVVVRQAVVQVLHPVVFLAVVLVVLVL